MGLDITYYRQATSPTEQQAAALQQFRGDDRRDKAAGLGMHCVWINKSFPGREEGIPPHEFVAAECVGGFCAGSYTGYGRWRSQLAELVGRQQRSDSPGPFMELTYFSDCEGVIGPVVSAKLAKDFAMYQPFADSHSDEWFRKKYAEWRVAFETAADGGFVDFH